MKKTKDGKVLWINCAKFLSIFAVLVDHLKGIVYESENIQYLSFFSVSAFLFLSGMTTFYSLRNHREDVPWRSWVVRRLGKILVPYLAAVAVYQFVESGYTWNAVQFLAWVIHFNIEGQFYFVLIYLQLVAAAPPLYLVIRAIGRSRWKAIGRLLLLGAAWFASGLCVERTFILDIYGGGKHLFGGTYFFLFVLGMMAADMDLVIKNKKQAIAAVCASGLAVAGTAIFMLADRFALDHSIFSYDIKVNPPGITLSFYSLAVVFLIFSVCSLVDQLKIRPLDILLQAMNWLGGYTLYIFLYHMLILHQFLEKNTVLANLPQSIQFLLYMAAMIGIPVLGKWLYAHVRKMLVRLEKPAEV